MDTCCPLKCFQTHLRHPSSSIFCEIATISKHSGESFTILIIFIYFHITESYRFYTLSHAETVCSIIPTKKQVRYQLASHLLEQFDYSSSAASSLSASSVSSAFSSAKLFSTLYSSFLSSIHVGNCSDTFAYT